MRQSAWRGKLQEPKNENAARTFAISVELAENLRVFKCGWYSNPSRLLFASRTGTPWDANLLVKRKLHPLLKKPNIERCGLHVFRHANATLMDRLVVPLKLRQQRLGQSDAEMTLGVYSHVSREDDMRIAGRLGKILDPIGPILKNEGAASLKQPLVN